MNELDLCYISAVDAIAAFKARKLSPAEILRLIDGLRPAPLPP